MRHVTAHNKSTVYINAGWIYPAERAAEEKGFSYQNSVVLRDLRG